MYIFLFKEQNMKATCFEKRFNVEEIKITRQKGVIGGDGSL